MNPELAFTGRSKKHYNKLVKILKEIEVPPRVTLIPGRRPPDGVYLMARFPGGMNVWKFNTKPKKNDVQEWVNEQA